LGSKTSQGLVTMQTGRKGVF